MNTNEYELGNGAIPGVVPAVLTGLGVVATAAVSTVDTATVGLLSFIALSDDLFCGQLKVPNFNDCYFYCSRGRLDDLAIASKSKSLALRLSTKDNELRLIDLSKNVSYVLFVPTPLKVASSAISWGRSVKTVLEYSELRSIPKIQYHPYPGVDMLKGLTDAIKAKWFAKIGSNAVLPPNLFLEIKVVSESNVKIAPPERDKTISPFI